MSREKSFTPHPEAEQEKLSYLKAITDVAELELTDAAKAVDAFPQAGHFHTWDDSKKTSAPTSLDYSRARAEGYHEEREADFIIAENDEGLVRARQEREEREKLLAKQKLASLFPHSDVGVAQSLETIRILKKEAGDIYIKCQVQEKNMRDSGANFILIQAAAEETARARKEYLALIDALEA